MEKEINIGFVGCSDVPNSAVEKEMRDEISRIFSIIERKYCNEQHQDVEINIITGATNCGISKYVYETATKFNNEYGQWFTLVGVMAKEGYKYELYPCDVIYALGEKFGDESEFFIKIVDELYKIGGGNQSQREFAMAQEKGIPCYEYSVKSVK